MPALNDLLRAQQRKAEQAAVKLPYVEIVMAIFESGYTGRYSVDCKDGQPRRFSFGDGLCVDVKAKS